MLALCVLVIPLHGVSGGDASGDLDGGYQVFLPFVFRNEPPFTFTVMADTHSGIDENKYPERRKEVDEYHRNAVARVRAIHPPFYMVVGDLV